MQQILAAVYDNDAATQLKHIEAIQQHINDQDEFATYATDLKTAAQAILDSSVQSIGHNPVDIEEYMKAAKALESGEPVEDQELVNVISQLKERKEQLKAASEDVRNAQFGQMMQTAYTANANRQQGVHKHHAPTHRRVHFTKSESPAPEPSTDDQSEEWASNRVWSVAHNLFVLLIRCE